MPNDNNVSRGELIESFLIFTGCKADENNNCNVVIAYKVMTPSGNLYASSDQIEAWSNKPAPAKGKLELSINRMGLIIEPEDELGEYTVMCMVWDLNAGTNLLTTQKFVAVE